MYKTILAIRTSYTTQKKRVRTSRYIKWAEWNNTDWEETMNMHHNFNKKDLLPGIEEFAEQAMNPTSDS